MATIHADHAVHANEFGAEREASFPRRFWTTTKLVLGSVAKSMEVYRDMDRRIALSNRLFAMSDAELAEMGIKRDQIHHHVFRDFLAN